jgi:hypothetical protein
VGNHNFFDISALDLFQKPRETFTLVVDTGTDVCEYFVVGEVVLHRLNLFDKVFLFCRRDTTVDVSLGERVRFSVRSKVGDSAVKGGEAVDIEVFVTTSRRFELDAPLFGLVLKTDQRFRCSHIR